MAITRFAPSPTGLLHLGHAFAALCVHDRARAEGWRMLLRIEDIDTTRCRPGFETALLEDLRWLGIAWEEPVRRQSDHMDDYAAALDQLRARGLVYRCFRTRREIAAASASAPHGPACAEPGGPLPDEEEQALLEAGRAYAWRLSLDAARQTLGPQAWEGLGFVSDGVWTRAEPARHGDAVLARKDTPASYHLASVHDDALQGITHVIRGEDLADAPHLHVLLQALMGWPTPAYHHHRLICDDHGRRLAKRDHAATLVSLRAAGATPLDVRARLGL
jgi:glutamyl-Q tRNA(Asp) synthetase